MKRKLKILGIIFITLLMPLVINFVNFIIIFSLQDRFRITNNSIPFTIHLFGLILLFVFFVDYFYKNKREVFSRCLYIWYMFDFYIHRNASFFYWHTGLSLSFILWQNDKFAWLLSLIYRNRYENCK